MRFLVFLSFYVLGTLYVAERFLATLALPAWSTILVGLFIAAFATTMPLAFYLRRRLSRSLAAVLYLVGGYYAAWLLWGWIAAGATDGFRVFAWTLGYAFPPGLGGTVVIGILAAMGFLTAYGTFAAAATPRARRLDIGIPDLPEHLDGVTVAHLTDLHVGYIHRAGRLARIVETTNAEHPDLIVLTGDQADGDPDAFIGEAGPFGRLRASLGVYAVNGNHEHYGDAFRVDAELARAGIIVLQNQWVEAAPNLVVAGLEDPAGRLSGVGPDLDATLSGIPSEATVILLSHQAQCFDRACAAGVDLVLSGHTHGGQIWPWAFVVRRFHRYVSGYHRRGTCHLSISNGAGTWGPLLRVGAPPEILVYRLARAVPGAISRRRQRRLFRRKAEPAAR